MPLTMLNYGKIILEKVSFDKYLFWKEYNKFCNELKQDECEELVEWVTDKYQDSTLIKIDLKKKSISEN